MANTSFLEANWNRAIFVNQALDDDYVRRLTPDILRLRQESGDPITIGIDSPGGSLASLDALLGLLRGADQSGKTPKIITVSTNRAYSAAASLLTLGNYAVALPHSKILFHDVRYSDLDDVTPSKARSAAKELQDENESYSLKLSSSVISRLVWNYSDLYPGFSAIREKFPRTHKRYSDLVGSYAASASGPQGMDIVGFATALYSRLSPLNDEIIGDVMQRLATWIEMTSLHESIPAVRQKGSRIPGLLDGAIYLHRQVAKKLERPATDLVPFQGQLKLLISLAVTGVTRRRTLRSSNFGQLLETLVHDFALIESINDPKHAEIALALMKEYEGPFFGEDATRELAGMSAEDKEKYIERFVPSARLFWYFCVLLCRALFEGEHLLSPGDAQLLGLIDEVAGGGPIESHREYLLKVETT